MGADHLRMTFEITMKDTSTPNVARVGVFNLKDSSTNPTFFVGKRVKVSAGYVTGSSHILFDGETIQARNLRADVTDKVLAIIATDKGNARNYAVVNKTLSAGHTHTRLQATVSALSDKLLISLAPAMERILKGFNDWIAANPGKVDEILTGISNAAIWLATKFGDLLKLFTGANGDEFMKKWEAFGSKIKLFADNVDRIANGIEKIEKFVKWATGTNTILGKPERTAELLNQMRNERESGVSFDAQREKKADSGITGLARRAWRATKKVFGDGEAEAHGGPGSLPAESDGTITTHGHRWKPGASTAGGKERVGSWLKFFQAPVAEGGMGADLETSRAMVAMMQGESGANLNPAAAGDAVNGVNTSFGTAQWHNERFTQLKAFAARMGAEWTDVGAQQQFLRHEFLHGNYQGVWNRIKDAPTGESKLRAGIEGYERPKYPGKAFDFRVPNLNALRRSGAGVAPADAANSKIVVPPPAAGVRGLPNMTPGGFDPNKIDTASIMKADPATAPSVMNSTTSSSRSLTQNNTFKVDITGSQTPKEHARAFTQSADGLYALAMRNAQSATV